MNRDIVRKAHSLKSVAGLLACLSMLLIIPAVAQQQVKKTSPQVSKTLDPSIPARSHPQFAGNIKAPQGSLFFPAVSYPLGGYGLAVAVADLNGDGILDAVVGNQNGTVSVLLGNGDGTFAAAVSYNAGGGPLVLIADLNGDHIPDLIVQGNTNSDSVAVLIGNGDGTFRTAVSYPTGGYEYSGSAQIAVADVNGDGKPDLLGVNQCDISTENCEYGSVGVLLGNGDGTFQPAVTYASGGFLAGSLVVADLSGDGKLDVAVSNCAALGMTQCKGVGSIGVMLGNGDGTFQPATSYRSGSVEFFFSPLAVADVNNDSHIDLLIADEGGDDGNGEGSAGVLLGKGNGTFHPVTTFDSGGDFACSIAIADLNGDGKLDLALTNASGSVGVLLGNGDGTFLPVQSYDAGGANSSVSVLITDVNADGIPDMVVQTRDPVEVLIGNGDGTFQPAQSYEPGADPYGLTAAAMTVADLNGDGRPDVLTAGGTLGVLLSNSAATNPTTTTIQSSLNPSVFGQTVTFTATVQSPSGVPAGTVIFYDSSTSLGSGTLANGVASLTTSSLSAGSHSITAAYQGNSNFDASTSQVLNQVVNGVSTSTSVSSSLNPSNFGQSVTFTATVASSGGTPTGTVIFYDGTAALGSAALSGGTALFSTSSLSVGTHPITAAFQGSQAFSPSTSPVLNQVVNSTASPTSTSLSSSRNPCLKPCGVTFTAVVTSAAGTPTGTVSFSDDEPRFLGTATLSNGVASVAPSGFHHGTWQITATYNGSTDFAPSTSPVLDQEVFEQPVPTQTYVSTSGSPSFVGQPVSFSAGVSPNRGSVPDGENLYFYDGHELLGAVPMSNEGAHLTTSSLEVGKHNILVTYNGDGLYESSHGMVVQVVVKYSTTTTLVSSVNPSVSGQPVTMTVTVTSSGPTPTGFVMLKGFGTLTLVGGTASATKSNFTVGSHSLTAKYKGDDLSAASTSEVLVQVVNPD